MRVTWEVDDGYAGGSRPQHTEVDEGDIESCDTLEEAMKLVDDCIQDAFEQNISWFTKHREQIEKEVQKILDNKEED